MIRSSLQRRRIRQPKDINNSDFFKSLARLKRKRPRLYIDTEKVEFLKQRLVVYPYSKFWEYVKNRADYYVRVQLPEDLSQYDDDTIRFLGKRLYYLSMSYLLTEDISYLDAAKRHMFLFCSDPNWASNSDHGMAHILFGMSIAYDWLYDCFTENERSEYRDAMIYHASLFYSYLYEKEIWWSQTRLQNHNYRNVMSLAVTGICLFGEEKDAIKWIILAKQNFDNILNALPKDGTSIEGSSYWSGGLEALLFYFAAVEEVFGWKSFLMHPYFRRACEYRWHMSTPDLVEVINYGDAIVSDWHGPGFLLRFLGSYYDDGGVNNFVSEKLETVASEVGAHTRPCPDWFDLNWYDELKGFLSPPKENFVYFKDLGIVVNRKNWDETDSSNYLQFFKCGYPIGRHLHEKEEGAKDGSGHIHPDEGNFLLWAYGKWILVEDGYSYNKQTTDHNLVVPNGCCQLGGNRKWFSVKDFVEYSGDARIVLVKNAHNYKYIVSDLTDAYPKGNDGLCDANLSLLERVVVFLPFGYIVVRDHVLLKEEGYIDTYLHFNPEGTLTYNGSCYAFSVDTVIAEVYNVGVIPDSFLIQREAKDYLLHKEEDLYLKESFYNRADILHLRFIRVYDTGFPNPGILRFRVFSEIFEFDDNYLSGRIDFQNMIAVIFEKVNF